MSGVYFSLLKICIKISMILYFIQVHALTLKSTTTLFMITALYAFDKGIWLSVNPTNGEYITINEAQGLLEKSLVPKEVLHRIMEVSILSPNLQSSLTYYIPMLDCE